jgi:hypothetical protein
MSERAFSAMNYVQEEHRTCLTVHQQEKCLFNYINARTLERIQEGVQILTTYTA